VYKINTDRNKGPSILFIVDTATNRKIKISIRSKRMMHTKVTFLCLLCIPKNASGFAVSQICDSPPTASITRLEAKGTKGRLWKPALSGAMMGWVLATKIATASSTPQDLVLPLEYLPLREAFPTTILAGGAYTPEGGYDSLNMELPSYSVKKDVRFDAGSAADEDIAANAKGSQKQARGQQKSLADVEKNRAKDKAAKEEASMKEYAIKQQARSREKAEKGKIRAKIEAERNEAKEAQALERAERENKNGQ